MKSPHPFGWVGFFTQFFFGALFGAGAGVVLLSKSSYAGSPSSTPACIFIGGGALLCGVAAGLFGDDFWRSKWG